MSTHLEMLPNQTILTKNEEPNKERGINKHGVSALNLTSKNLIIDNFVF